MLTITHTPAEGTLIDGTAKGDGTAEVLKANGWRWGRSIGCWYVPHSRDRLPKTHLIDATISALTKAAFAVETELDHRLRPAAEVEETRIQRQDDRAAALDAKAERKAAAAEAAWNRANAATAALPEGGEPIKIGHHSENRHRNAIERAHNRLGAAVGADRDAEYASERARTAEATTGARYSVRTVANRIEKLKAEERGLQRKLDGYTAGSGTPYARQIPAASNTYRERVEISLEGVRDHITYWEGVRADQIANGEATNYSRENIAKADAVKVSGQWREVVRVNAKTVSVTTGYSWTDRVPYAHIQDHCPANG